MFLQRADINSFDSVHLADISYRVLHDLLLFIYSGYSALVNDKPFDLVPPAALDAAAAAADADDDERVHSELLRQLILAAERYQVVELKFKAEEALSKLESVQGYDSD